MLFNLKADDSSVQHISMAVLCKPVSTLMSALDTVYVLVLLFRMLYPPASGVEATQASS